MIPKNIQAPETESFWIDKDLPRWEQHVFRVVNFPFNILATVFSFFFHFVYMILGFFALPLVWLLNLIWLVCYGLILGLSFVTEHMKMLRPISFVLGLPFLIFGHFVINLSPLFNPPDMVGAVRKRDIVETFPWVCSLMKAAGDPIDFPTPDAEDELENIHED